MYYEQKICVYIYIYTKYMDMKNGLIYVYIYADCKVINLLNIYPEKWIIYYMYMK